MTQKHAGYALIALGLAMIASAADWTPPSLRTQLAQAKLMESQIQAESAEDGEPPKDDKGVVTETFRQRLLNEWVLYRMRERKRGTEHVPPKDFIYGPTWASVNLSWRIASEIKALDTWANLERHGLIDRALGGSR